MIGFQAPLWLLLLGLIPLIRWLHRFRLKSRILPSTTLFLWSRLQPFSAPDGNPDKPDPRWILRALISTLLILALAKPYLQTTAGLPLDVWIDDSLSMFVREQKHSRMRAGLLQLQSYLGAHEFSHIKLHSLGDPTALLSLDPEDNSDWAAQLDAWVSQPRPEPLPPSVISLSKLSHHILVTDGADRSLNRWAQSAPLDHIIQVGKLRHNLVLSRLNLRHALSDSGPVTGTARIDNLGNSAANLRLVIKQQENTIKNMALEIPPLGNMSTSFSIAPGTTGSLQARLESADDPLLLDNSLELDLAKLQPSLGYSILGDCGPGLIAVIDSQPSFVKAKGAADLLINCSGEAQNSTLPTLMLHRLLNARRTTQSAHWHKELSMGYLPVAAGVAYSDEAPALSSVNFPILSANGRMLILQKPGADNVIDCYLDTSDAAFSREAQYPLLMLALISRLTQRSLVTNPLTVSRDIKASRIAPIAFPIGIASQPGLQPAQVLFTSPILFAVLLLLIMDATLGLLLASGKLNWQP